MSRAQREFDRLSAEVWRDFRGDVSRSARRIGKAGAACVKKHPFLVLAAGGLLTGLAVYQWRRSPPVERPRRKLGRLARRLFQAGRLWMMRWLASLSNPESENELESPADSIHTNGRTH